MNLFLLNALAAIHSAWVAFSPAATLLGLSGIALVVVAFLGVTVLPAFIKRPLVGLGIVLIVVAAVWQAAQAKGAHDAFKLDAERALNAEAMRRGLAEKINRDDRAAAEAAIAAAQAESLHLKELNDALAQDRERDRRCTTRDDARRLRRL